MDQRATLVVAGGGKVGEDYWGQFTSRSCVAAGYLGEMMPRAVRSLGPVISRFYGGFVQTGEEMRMGFRRAAEICESATLQPAFPVHSRGDGWALVIEPGDPHQAGLSVIEMVTMTGVLPMPGFFDSLQMVGEALLLETPNRVVDRGAVADHTAAEIRLQRLLVAVVDLAHRHSQPQVEFHGSGPRLETRLHAVLTSCDGGLQLVRAPNSPPHHRLGICHPRNHKRQQPG